MTEKNIKSIWSSFWLDDEQELHLPFDEDLVFESKDSELNNGSLDVNILKLASARRAIANFVNILTLKDIPVYFWNGDTGLTNGKVVYLSSDIVKREDFDPAVGLALHEAVHIIETDFDLIKTVWGRISELYRIGKEIGLIKERVAKFTHLMVNYVEDRYIDDKQFRMAPGYRPYYVALYEKYFNNKEIGKYLQSSLFTTPTLSSYEYRIINFTNPMTNLDALPGLREIAQELSLNTISRLKTTKDRIKLAIDLTRIVFNSIKNSTEEKQNQITDSITNQSNFENSKNSIQNEDDVIGGEYEEIDIVDQSSNKEGNKNSEYEEFGNINGFTKKQLKQIKLSLDIQKQFINGHSNVNKKKVSDKQKCLLDIIEKSGISMVTVGMDLTPTNTPAFGVDCVIVKRLTKELMFSGLFPLCDKQQQIGDPVPDQNVKDAVIKGIQLGTRLGKKLQLRQEINVTTYPRRKSGKIFKRHLHEFINGSKSFFYKVHCDKFNKINIHISVDASGSMSDVGKWERTMTMLVAIAKAGSMIDNLRVCISFRTTISSNNSGYYDSLPYIILAYDSAKDKFFKIKNLFQFLTPKGLTPEGLCFEATMKQLVNNKPGEIYYFLNISDGEPCFSYSGPNGIPVIYDRNIGSEHTKKQYKKILESGVRGISYFIDSYSSVYSLNNLTDNKKAAFKRMYGKDAKFIDVNNITSIAKTMNELFLNKE